MLELSRRKFLHHSVLGTITTATLAYAGLWAKNAYAAWPTLAYQSDNVDDVLKKLYGDTGIITSTDISIKAPAIAENGAVVPVSVSSNIKGIESISILVEDNPNPLVAQFNMVKNQRGYINTRIKMGKTSNVIAVVKADGKLYSAKQIVKVTIGGCGG